MYFHTSPLSYLEILLPLHFLPQPIKNSFHLLTKRKIPPNYKSPALNQSTTARDDIPFMLRICALLSRIQTSLTNISRPGATTVLVCCSSLSSTVFRFHYFFHQRVKSISSMSKLRFWGKLILMKQVLEANGSASSSLGFFVWCLLVSAAIGAFENIELQPVLFI